MTLSQNSVSAYEVTLTFCDEDDADLLFNSLHGVEDSSKGASYVNFKLGLRFAHLYPSHGLALATIACLSVGRSVIPLLMIDTPAMPSGPLSLSILA